MDGPVAAFDGEQHLSKSPLRQPVMNMLWFELQKLLPAEGAALWVATEVAIVSKSHQITQRVLVTGVPGHAPLVVYLIGSVVACVHLRQLAFSHSSEHIRLPPLLRWRGWRRGALVKRARIRDLDAVVRRVQGGRAIIVA